MFLLPAAFPVEFGWEIHTPSRIPVKVRLLVWFVYRIQLGLTASRCDPVCKYLFPLHPEVHHQEAACPWALLADARGAAADAGNLEAVAAGVVQRPGFCPRQQFSPATTGIDLFEELWWIGGGV